MVKLVKNYYESKMFEYDNDFLVEKLKETYKITWAEAIKKIKLKDYELSEDELDEIDEEKDLYYSGDFWQDTETLMDNINWIRWNFYWDKENNEIIFNFWNTTEWDFIHTDEIDTDLELNKDYQKLFDAFCDNKFNGIEESDFIKLSDDSDGSWQSKYINLDKPDFIIKYRWGQWYIYSFFEYIFTK